MIEALREVGLSAIVMVQWSCAQALKSLVAPTDPKPVARSYLTVAGCGLVLGIRRKALADDGAAGSTETVEKQAVAILPAGKVNITTGNVVKDAGTGGKHSVGLACSARRSARLFVQPGVALAADAGPCSNSCRIVPTHFAANSFPPA
jgi:hypothetical protein